MALGSLAARMCGLSVFVVYRDSEIKFSNLPGICIHSQSQYKSLNPKEDWEITVKGWEIRSDYSGSCTETKIGISRLITALVGTERNCSCTLTVTRMFTDCDPSDNDGKEGEKICSKKVLHRRLLVGQSNVDHDVVSSGDYLFNSRDTLFVICHRCTKV